MSNYQRLISYIYAYEGGIKGKNIGFVKLDTRGSQCKIAINVKKIFVGGNPLGVYLLADQGEVRIGTLFARNGTGEFRTAVNSANVENSGCGMEAFYGLSIHDVESAWRAYTTIWEDAVAHAAEIELADVTAENVKKKQTSQTAGDDGAQAEQAEDSLPISREIEAELEKEEAGLPSAARDAEKEQSEAQDETQGNEGLPVNLPDEAPADSPGVRTEEAPESAPGIQSAEALESMSGAKPEEKPETMLGIRPVESLESVERPRPMRTSEHLFVVRPEKMQEAMQGTSGGEMSESLPEPTRTREETVEKAAEAPLQKPAREKAWKGPHVDLERSFGQIAAQDPHVRDWGERGGVRAKLLGGQKSEMEVCGAVDLTGTQSAEKCMGPETVETVENSGEQTESPMRYQEAAREEIPAARIPTPREQRENFGHQEMWEMLQKKYPKILAFDYADGCEILIVKPQDIGLLPRENWIYGNNSFLLHGYYNYRYLILARLENPNGKARYLLGVPGNYFSNEKYMAAMFGFPDFVLSKKQPRKDGRFGYWYTDIKIGE